MIKSAESAGTYANRAGKNRVKRGGYTVEAAGSGSLLYQILGCLACPLKFCEAMPVRAPTLKLLEAWRRRYRDDELLNDIDYDTWGEASS